MYYCNGPSKLYKVDQSVSLFSTKSALFGILSFSSKSLLSAKSIRFSSKKSFLYFDFFFGFYSNLLSIFSSENKTLLGSVFRLLNIVFASFSIFFIFHFLFLVWNRLIRLFNITFIIGFIIIILSIIISSSIFDVSNISVLFNIFWG